MASPTQSFSETKTTRLSEFITKGDWHLVNMFSIFGHIYIENGVLKGAGICGTVTGQPICSCGYCGFIPLVNHFSIKDKKTGKILNVGEMCLGHIIGTKRADAITSGFQSVKRKIEGDFRKKVYFEQMIDWLNEHADNLHKSRNERIDTELKQNPQYFWKPEIENYVIYKFGSPVKKSRKLTEPERRVGKERRETFERGFWQYSKERMPIRHWNPYTMKKVFNAELEKDGVVEIQVPKLRKKTEKEQKKISETIQTQTENYLTRMKLLERERKNEVQN